MKGRLALEFTEAAWIMFILEIVQGWLKEDQETYSV